MSSPHDKLVPEPSEEARDGVESSSIGQGAVPVLAFPPPVSPLPSSPTPPRGDEEGSDRSVTPEEYRPLAAAICEAIEAARASGQRVTGAHLTVGRDRDVGSRAKRVRRDPPPSSEDGDEEADPGLDRQGESGSESSGATTVDAVSVVEGESDVEYPTWEDTGSDGRTEPEHVEIDWNVVIRENAARRTFRSCCYIVLNRIRALRAQVMAREIRRGITEEEQSRESEKLLELHVIQVWEMARIPLWRQLAGMMIAANCREPDEECLPRVWLGGSRHPPPIVLARHVWYLEMTRGATLSWEQWGDGINVYLRWEEEYAGQWEEYLDLGGVQPGGPGRRRMFIGPEDGPVRQRVWCI